MEAVMFLHNFGTDLLNHTTSCLRKTMFSRLPQWDLQNSHDIDNM